MFWDERSAWPYADRPRDVRESADQMMVEAERVSLLSRFGLASSLSGALAPWERRTDCEQGHDWNQGPGAAESLTKRHLEELSSEDLDTLYWWVAEGPSLYFDAKGLADLDRDLGPGTAVRFKETYTAFGLPLDPRHDEARATAIGRFIGDRLRSILVSLDPADLKLDFGIDQALLASYVGLLLSGLARVHVPTLLTLTRRLGLQPRRSSTGSTLWCTPVGSGARDRATAFQAILDMGLKGDPKACTPPPLGTKYRPLYDWLDGMTYLGIDVLSTAWRTVAEPQPDDRDVMRLELIKRDDNEKREGVVTDNRHEGRRGWSLGKVGVIDMDTNGRTFKRRRYIELSPRILPESALSPSWWSNGKAQVKTWRRAWQATGFTAHPVVVDGVVVAVDFREMSEERTGWRMRRDFERQPSWHPAFAPVANPSGASIDAGPAGSGDARYTDALLTNVWARVSHDHVAAYTLNRTRILGDLCTLYERRDQHTEQHLQRADLRAKALEALARDPRRGSTNRVATEFGISRRTLERWRRSAAVSDDTSEPST